MRWSALKKLIHNLWVEDLGLEIFCTAYRRKEGPELGCYWIKLGERTIWSRPEDIKEELSRNEYNPIATEVTNFIRTYLDTPREQLFELPNPVGLLGIFLAADRRTGKRRLVEVAATFPEDGVVAIIERRHALK